MKSDEATIAPMRVRSYAYCSDTAFLPGLAQDIHQCDLLYHEATFDDDLARRAKETFHSTARQAGRIAAQAEVGKLIIGHFSSRYKDLSNLLVQAQEEFSNTQLAIEGEVFNIG